MLHSMGLQRVGHNLETNGLHELKGGFMTEPQQQSCVWFRGPLIHLLQVVMKTMNKKIVSFPQHTKGTISEGEAETIDSMLAKTRRTDLQTGSGK